MHSPGTPAAHRPNAARAKGRPFDLLLMAAAGLILISVARLHAFIPGLAAVRPALMLLLVGLGALFIGYRGPRKLRYLRSGLGSLMVFFVLWATIGVPFAMYKGKAAEELVLGLWVESLVILVLVSSVRSIEDFKRLLGVFAIGAVAYAFLAQGTGSRRVGGGGYDANDAAMFIVSGIPLIMYFLVRAKNTRNKVIFGLGVATCGSAVVLSGSRGGFLALVAVLGYSLFFLKGIKPGMRLAVVAVACLVVVSQANSDFWDRMQSITAEDDYNRTSYTGRKQIWERGMGYMMANPIFGVGIANFTYAEGNHPDALARLERGKGVKFSAPHSIWVQTAAETGVPGFLAFLGMFLLSFRILWSPDRYAGRAVRGSPELQPLRELSRSLIGVLIGVMVAGSFLSRAYASVVWMPVGLALSVVKLMRLKEMEYARAYKKRRAWERHVALQRMAGGGVPSRVIPPLEGRELPSRP